MLLNCLPVVFVENCSSYTFEIGMFLAEFYRYHRRDMYLNYVTVRTTRRLISQADDLSKRCSVAWWYLPLSHLFEIRTLRSLVFVALSWHSWPVYYGFKILRSNTASIRKPTLIGLIFGRYSEVQTFGLNTQATFRFCSSVRVLRFAFP